MRLSEAAAALDGRFWGQDREFSGVGIDSRSIAMGELFVALKGPRFDGHDFLVQAASRGAAGALVQEEWTGAMPAIRVADTRMALGHLARQWRARFNIPVIAITGSNGKTTVKGMVASILSQSARGTVTRGNLNNDLGVPLTLLRMRSGDRFAVIEMGMNRQGEIFYLTGLAAPTVAVVTNAAVAHLEGLGSVEAVAQAKGEIFSGLSPDGIAVINRHDRYCDLWRQLAGGRRVLTFGFGEADVHGDADCRSDGCRLRIRWQGPSALQEVEARLRLLGRHNALNAIAAAAAALAAGAEPGHIVRGIEEMVPVSGRLEPRRGRGGALVINDTYTANPGSLAAAIGVLQSLPGEKILVLGDMMELGATADERHAEAGTLARSAGIDRLMAIGERSALAVEHFGPGAALFTSVDELSEALRGAMHAEMTVLVKGSRSMRMERVVDAISESPIGAGH